MAEPILSIVVLQWNRVDLTRQCVASIREQSSLPYEIIIVDNGSDADADQWAKEHADTAVLLDSNLGFAAGMNAGLKRARGRKIAFVSNDTILPPNWDERLVATSEGSGAGITVPAVSGGGNASSVRSCVGDSTHIARPFIDLPSGIIYVMDTTLVRSIGGWREDYAVASSEDLDLLFAIWSIGREVIIDERVFVEHVGRATADSQLTNRAQIWRRNRLQFSETWGSMDETTFRSRYDWSGPVSTEHLEQARIAAYWMGRYFTADDDVSRLRWERSKSAERPTTEPQQDRSRWWRRPFDRTS